MFKIKQVDTNTIEITYKDIKIILDNRAYVFVGFVAGLVLAIIVLISIDIKNSRIRTIKALRQAYFVRETRKQQDNADRYIKDWSDNFDKNKFDEAAL